MPRLQGVEITKAWWHQDEGPERIHFTVTRSGGPVRHLYTDAPSALHAVLQEHLDGLGYSGPGGETDT